MLEQIRWGEGKKKGKRKKRKEKKEEEKRSEKLHILSRIYGDRGRRFSSEEEAKFIYATRALRRYKNPGFSSNSER